MIQKLVQTIFTEWHEEDIVELIELIDSYPDWDIALYNQLAKKLSRKYPEKARELFGEENQDV